MRLICSEDMFADHSGSTLEALRQKHPPQNPDSSIPDLSINDPLPFPIDAALIRKTISSFPNGSGGGPDGLLPQHLKDLTGPSAGDGGVFLLKALTALVTLVLEGRTPEAIRPLFFGASLTALKKKNGGIRPIAVGCTIRRLASKCACLHALNSIPQLLSLYQMGFGISGGAEAAVHAGRVYLNNLSSQKAIVKVDSRMLLTVSDEIKSFWLSVSSFLICYPSLTLLIPPIQSSGGMMFRLPHPRASNREILLVLCCFA